MRLGAGSSFMHLHGYSARESLGGITLPMPNPENVSPAGRVDSLGSQMTDSARNTALPRNQAFGCFRATGRPEGGFAQGPARSINNRYMLKNIACSSTQANSRSDPRPPLGRFGRVLGLDIAQLPKQKSSRLANHQMPKRAILSLQSDGGGSHKGIKLKKRARAVSLVYFGLSVGGWVLLFPFILIHFCTYLLF